MAEYDPLETYLARRGTEEVELGIAEVERIIGNELPASASRPRWRANESIAAGHVQCRAWQNVGFDAFLVRRSRVLFRSRCNR